MPKRNKTTRFSRWKQTTFRNFNLRAAVRNHFFAIAFIVAMVPATIYVATSSTAPKVQPIQGLPLAETAIPTKVIVPGTSIDLSVTPASISGGVWETSETSASHLSSSANPGDGSNVVIYGHNRPHLLQQLHNVELGDEIILENKHGTTYHYTIETKEVVPPTDISKVAPTQNEKLTIYTCTNFFDSDRLVVSGRLQKVSSVATAVTDADLN